MKKVLYVASTCGHLRHFHRPYLAFFRDRGWTVHAACGGGTDGLPEAHRVIEAPFRKKLTSLANLKVSAMLRRLIKQEKYDLIVVHTSLAAFFTRLAVMGMRKRPKVINMVHGYLFDEKTPLPKRLLMLGAERITAPVTDLLLTMNRDDRELAERYKLGRHRDFVWGIGLDPEKLAAPAQDAVEALRQSLSLPEDAFMMLYAAEFSHRKDQKTLLHAMTHLPERAVLLLAGDGELLDECKALAEELGIAERVIFPGRVSDMPLWYALGDCVVSSSRSEGLPFHILEPMYLGIPVVASDARGNRDLITHGETGLLFPIGDAGGCARQIETLMAMDTEDLTQKAKERTEAYLLPKVLPQIGEKYLSV